jgi:hypothetical protein
MPFVRMGTARDSNGECVYINVDHIVSVGPAESSDTGYRPGANVVVKMSNGDMHFLRQDVNKLMEMIANALGCYQVVDDEDRHADDEYES